VFSNQIFTMPTLVIQLPNLPPVEHVLREDTVTIGRMKGNTIALDDISVSLSHARITRKDGDYFLKDLNSTNGTMLNGQSVTEARLRDGDHVKFGEVTGRFYATAAPLSPSVNAPSATVAPVTAPATPPPSAPSAPVPAPQPIVAPLPTSSSPQVAAPSVAQPEPAKKSFPMVPVLIGVVVVAAAGLLVWKFFFSDAKESTAAPPSMASATSVPGKAKLTNPPALSGSATSSVASTKAMPRDVPALVQFLKSDDVTERRRAAAMLNSMGVAAKDAVPELREAIKDPDAEVRMWSALSLINNNVYDKATVPILVQLLHHESPVLRQVACLSLALIPYEEQEKDPVISALTETANKDDSAEVRSAAVSAMKIIVAPSAPPSR
jgi:pSer/pThr/pTyr-binding forkhead associated (FHA) protein